MLAKARRMAYDFVHTIYSWDSLCYLEVFD